MPKSDSEPGFVHLPVLAGPVCAGFAEISGLLDRPNALGGVLVDCTLGGAGHSALLLAAHPGLHLLGLDQDPTALAAAAEHLAAFGERVKMIETNFADFVPSAPVVAVLADLGVSSPQLDVAARGFSFSSDGPLDMRMNPQAAETAAALIERLDETALADLIYSYGEERLSRRIARRIKQDLSTSGAYAGTKALAYAVAGCYPPKARRGRIHPATRTFQALRIAVNDELRVLDRLLTKVPDWLVPGGVFAVISFHSLEDRRVKTAFLNDERLERITRKPIVADPDEQQRNSRSRSAKLRFARAIGS